MTLKIHRKYPLNDDDRDRFLGLNPTVLTLIAAQVHQSVPPQGGRKELQIKIRYTHQGGRFRRVLHHRKWRHFALLRLLQTRHARYELSRLDLLPI